MSSSLFSIPPLIYGTAWKKERTAELVEKAVSCGFRGIDTACQPKHYHEAGVGEALKRLNALGINRKALFIQTKFTPFSGQDPATAPYNPSAAIADQVYQSFQVSLKNLGIDYIDALLLHSPFLRHAQTMEAWHAFEELYQRGGVHQLGISNCYELDSLELIFDEAEIKPTLLQNRFYGETDYDKKLRRWCNEKGIRYQSFWTLTANPHILGHPLMQTIAMARKITVEQLFFRFLTQHNIIPLIGTCSEIHMKEDLAIFEFALTQDEIAQIQYLL